MKKKHEVELPGSCLNRADDDEMIFVLLGRDVAAFETINAWIDARIKHGKNVDGDSQILGAKRCLEGMLAFQAFVENHGK